jgi:pilus assembly protein CpaE
VNNKRVLLIDQSQAARFELSRLAQKAGVEVVGESGLGTEAVSMAAELQPDAIICGMSQPAERAMQTMESLLDILPDTPIIAYGWGNDVDAVRRAMLAGARDFIVMPADAGRLMESLRTVLTAQERRRDRVSGETKARGTRGFVAAVFGAKGGIGKTTVATNLAVALAMRGGESVALIDCDDSFGDVAAVLDVPVRPGLLEFREVSAAPEREDLTAHLARHASGLYVLPAPQDPLQWKAVQPDDVHAAITVLARRFDIVIADTGGMLSDITLSVLKDADLVMWLTSSDYSSINNSVLALAALDRLSYPRERIRFVYNSVLGISDVPIEKLETALGAKFWWQIPNDLSLRAAAQAGRAAVLVDAKGAGARSIREMAGTLMGEAPTVAPVRRSPLRKLMPWRVKPAQAPATGGE